MSVMNPGSTLGGAFGAEVLRVAEEVQCVVVGDGAGEFGECAERCAIRVAKPDDDSFAAFMDSVVDDGERNGVKRFAGLNRERSASEGIIHARAECRAAGDGILDGYRTRSCR